MIGRERALVLVFGPMDDRPVDFQTLVLGPKPNQYLLCPEGYCAAEPHRVSPVFDGPVDTLRRRWQEMVGRQPRVEAIAADDEAMQYDYVQRSRLMRYPDTVTVKFIALDDGRSTLAVYSRSHYGRSDFGVNEKRIEAWLAAL